MPDSLDSSIGRHARRLPRPRLPHPRPNLDCRGRFRLSPGCQDGRHRRRSRGRCRGGRWAVRLLAAWPVAHRACAATPRD